MIKIGSGNWIADNLNSALGTWNGKLAEIWQLLSTTLEEFKGGSDPRNGVDDGTVPGGAGHDLHHHDGLRAVGADRYPLLAEMVIIIEDVGFMESIPLWVIALLGSLFIWVLSLIMILTVCSRFFKFYLAIFHYPPKLPASF